MVPTPKYANVSVSIICHIWVWWKNSVVFADVSSSGFDSASSSEPCLYQLHVSSCEAFRVYLCMWPLRNKEQEDSDCTDDSLFARVLIGRNVWVSVLQWWMQSGKTMTAPPPAHLPVWVGGRKRKSKKLQIEWWILNIKRVENTLRLAYEMQMLFTTTCT